VRRDVDTDLFGDNADLAADLPTRGESSVDVRICHARPDGRDHRGQVPSLELLAGRRSSDDIVRHWPSAGSAEKSTAIAITTPIAVATIPSAFIVSSPGSTDYIRGD
jgi:hypothetical protein